jgi:hypothetical protein
MGLILGVGETRVAEANELVERLSAAVGMIMEDSGPAALTTFPSTPQEVGARLRELDQAGQDVVTLVRAAQVLFRRSIR